MTLFTGWSFTPLETHSKNLAWIDGLLKVSKKHDAKLTFGKTSHPDWASTETNSITANRKVLERHAPKEGFLGGYYCANCISHATVEAVMSIAYPCKTTTDITEGLGIPE